LFLNYFYLHRYKILLSIAVVIIVFNQPFFLIPTVAAMAYLRNSEERYDNHLKPIEDKIPQIDERIG